MTKQKALEKLFKDHATKLKVQKFRYYHGGLSEKKQSEILIKYGFKLKNEENWVIHNKRLIK